MATWESQAASNLVMVHAIEGSPIADASGQLIGTALTLHGERVNSAERVTESYVLTDEDASDIETRGLRYAGVGRGALAPRPLCQGN